MKQNWFRALLEIGLLPAKRSIEKNLSQKSKIRLPLYLLSTPLVAGSLGAGALGYTTAFIADLSTRKRFELVNNFYKLTNKPVSKGRYVVEDFVRKKILGHKIGQIGSLRPYYRYVFRYKIPKDMREDEFVLCRAAQYGWLEVVQYLANLKTVNPSAGNNMALIMAADHGRLEVVKYLFEREDVRSAGNEGRALCGAARFGHLNVIQYLINIKGVDPAINNNAVIKDAVLSGRLDILQYLLGLEPFNSIEIHHKVLTLAADKAKFELVYYILSHKNVDPFVKDYHVVKAAAFHGKLSLIKILSGLKNFKLSTKNAEEVFFWAARGGDLQTLQYVERFKALNPDGDYSPAIVLAAEKSHYQIIEYLLTLEDIDPTVQENAALFYAVANGGLYGRDVIDLLIRDGRVSVTPRIRGLRNFEYWGRIKRVLLAYMNWNLSEEVSSLLKSHKSMLDYDKKSIQVISGAHDDYLRKEAERQQKSLSEQYAKDSLVEGLCLLRRLVFKALQSHLEKESPNDKKLTFLSENMEQLVSGNKQSLSRAASLFSSNDDIYEIASRAVNFKAPSYRWSNLLTAKSETGEWVQGYAANIAREIAKSEGQPYYESSLLELVYRLSEIRRANSRGETKDVPSCLAGTKARLVKVLSSHPEYSKYAKNSWKSACYSGAARYIGKCFRKQLEDIKSPKLAEQFFDSLLAMRLENTALLAKNSPVMMISGEKELYTRRHHQLRLAFIKKIEKGLKSSVNAYLCEWGLEPILEEDSRMVYLSFLSKGLGERWIAPQLSAIYLLYAPKAESEASVEPSAPLLLLPSAPHLSQHMMTPQQSMQALKVRFYEYCEQKHPGITISIEKVNDFFSGKKTPPKNEERMLFDSCLEASLEKTNNIRLNAKTDRKCVVVDI